MTGSQNPAPPGSRQTLALAVLVVWGLAVGLGVLEVAARLIEIPRPPRRARVSPEHRGLPKVLSVRSMLTPNIEGVLANGAYFRNNSGGFRGPEVDRIPPPGTFRIAVIGDSLTMGAGVANHEAYPPLVQSELEDRYPGGKFEVLNFGVGGLNTSAILARLRSAAAGYSPHMVVYGFTMNDLEGPGYVRNRPPQGGLAQRMRYQRFAKSPSHLLRFAWPRIQSLRDWISPPPQAAVRELRYNFFENPAAWSRFETSLAAMARLCRARRFKFVLFLHTRLTFLNWMHPFHPMYDKVAAKAAELQIPVIRSFDAFRGRHPESLWVSAFDPHPNPEAHRILARSLSDGLGRLPEEYFPRAAFGG